MFRIKEKILAASYVVSPGCRPALESPPNLLSWLSPSPLLLITVCSNWKYFEPPSKVKSTFNNLNWMGHMFYLEIVSPVVIFMQVQLVCMILFHIRLSIFHCQEPRQISKKNVMHSRNLSYIFYLSNRLPPHICA